MKRISIVAGHNPKGSGEVGASGNNFHEGNLTFELRNLIKVELESKGVKVITDNDKWNLSDVITNFKSWIKPTEIIMDIHFNASTSLIATGTEVLIPMNPTKKEINISNEIVKTISNILQIPNRGIKTELQSARGKLGFMRIPAENILIEVCFISNKRDMESYQKEKVKLSKSIANILISHA